MEQEHFKKHQARNRRLSIGGMAFGVMFMNNVLNGAPVDYLVNISKEISGFAFLPCWAKSKKEGRLLFSMVKDKKKSAKNLEKACI